MQTIQKEKMNIVIVGHVDHGKSTIIGRLLHDTHSLPEGKLEQVKNNCERNSKPFEYAFLIDALKDEQSQGITIDSARIFFKTEKRNYIIIDAPGHIEFLKNMITGASHADVAILVIDASEGIMENSKRHGYILSLLGIKQIVILVNKIDLIDYNKNIYDSIVHDYNSFLKQLNIIPQTYIPVIGISGDNITPNKNEISWYTGKSLLEIMDELVSESEISEQAFRMPVQDIYKFTKFGDNRRIIAGTILTGSVAVGDEVVFYPSGKTSTVKSIEGFNAEEKNRVSAPYATGLTLEEQIYITRGELTAKINETRPLVSSRFFVSLFWLSKKPMIKDKEYLLKIGCVKIPVKLVKIERVIDTSELNHIEDRHQIELHDVAECILKLSKPIAFDTSSQNSLTSRFVIVDNYEITGGGIIQKEITDSQEWIREKIILRNYKWEQSSILPEQRADRYNQKATLIIITGKKDSGKKKIARSLEKLLFDSGNFVYFLSIGNVLYGVDADIKNVPEKDIQAEHIRRLAEVSNILIDAGIILILTAIELTNDELNIIKTVLKIDNIETIWLGDEVTTDIPCDLFFNSNNELNEITEIIKGNLQDKGIIFKPW